MLIKVLEWCLTSFDIFIIRPRRHVRQLAVFMVGLLCSLEFLRCNCGLAGSGLEVSIRGHVWNMLVLYCRHHLL